eukprot:919377-Rhodomonas_salina.2
MIGKRMSGLESCMSAQTRYPRRGGWRSGLWREPSHGCQCPSPMAASGYHWQSRRAVSVRAKSNDLLGYSPRARLRVQETSKVTSSRWDPSQTVSAGSQKRFEGCRVLH